MSSIMTDVTLLDLKNRQTILVQSQEDCISQGFISQLYYRQDLMSATIGAGLLGASVAVIALKISRDNLILDREKEYRVNSYKFLRADLENGSYKTENIERVFNDQTLRNFRQDTFELHFASMFIDYVNYRISFEIFYSRVVRVWRNRKYTYKFSDQQEGEILSKIIQQACSEDIYDMRDYQDFLKRLMTIELEPDIRNLVLKLIPRWRRWLINLKLGR